MGEPELKRPKVQGAPSMLQGGNSWLQPGVARPPAPRYSLQPSSGKPAGLQPGTRFGAPQHPVQYARHNLVARSRPPTLFSNLWSSAPVAILKLPNAATDGRLQGPIPMGGLVKKLGQGGRETPSPHDREDSDNYLNMNNTGMNPIAPPKPSESGKTSPPYKLQLSSRLDAARPVGRQMVPEFSSTPHFHETKHLWAALQEIGNQINFQVGCAQVVLTGEEPVPPVCDAARVRHLWESVCSRKTTKSSVKEGLMLTWMRRYHGLLQELQSPCMLTFEVEDTEIPGVGLGLNRKYIFTWDPSLLEILAATDKAVLGRSVVPFDLK